MRKSSSKKVVNTFISYGILAVSFSVFVACQSKTVTPGAERLRIFESEPKGCLYMGEVSTVQENEESMTVGKEVEMNLNSRIDLRNKAFVLSGNVLVFMSKNKAKMATTSATSVDVPKKDNVAAKATDEKSEKVAQTVFLGTVFRCPPTIFNL